MPYQAQNLLSAAFTKKYPPEISSYACQNGVFLIE
jgi:hypothetical protein